MVTQSQRKLFKALADCADEFLEEILPETSGVTKFGREEVKRVSSSNPIEHSYAIISALNADNVMVSIDYEPGNSYSVSLLRKDTKLRNCWATEFLVRSTPDLIDTLRKGAQKLGVSI